MGRLGAPHELGWGGGLRNGLIHMSLAFDSPNATFGGFRTAESGQSMDPGTLTFWPKYPLHIGMPHTPYLLPITHGPSGGLHPATWPQAVPSSN